MKAANYSGAIGLIEATSYFSFLIRTIITCDRLFQVHDQNERNRVSFFVVHWYQQGGTNRFLVELAVV